MFESMYNEVLVKLLKARANRLLEVKLKETNSLVYGNLKKDSAWEYNSAQECIELFLS